MQDVLTQSPFTMVDWAWLLEFVTLTLAWIILGYAKDGKWKGLARAAADFCALFLSMNVLTLLGVFVTQQLHWDGFFPVLRVLVQGGVTLCYILLRLKGRRKIKLVLWLVMTTASLSIYAIAGKSSVLVGEYVAKGIAEGGTRVVIYLSLIGVAVWLRRDRFDDYPFIPTSGIALIAVGMVCVLLLYLVEVHSFGSYSLAYMVAMLVGYCAMLLMSLSAIHALYTMCREQQVIISLQAEQQRFISEQEQTRMTEAMLHNLRSIRHDLKNQYAYMQILLSEKRYAELETYFSELLTELPAPLQVVDCGNHMVNTVLNMEFAKLRADNIAFRHQLAVPPVLPFRDEDVCAILSNLIDNAADECRRLKAGGAADAEIRLDLHPHKSYLFIQCSNPTDRTLLVRNKSGLRTTKSEAELHGYGTQIVARLAEKYNGVSNFHLEDGRFVAQVMLDMAAEVEG